jgi:hypothetical protein
MRKALIVIALFVSVAATAQTTGGVPILTEGAQQILTESSSYLLTESGLDTTVISGEYQMGILFGTTFQTGGGGSVGQGSGYPTLATKGILGNIVFNDGYTGRKVIAAWSGLHTMMIVTAGATGTTTGDTLWATGLNDGWIYGSSTAPAQSVFVPILTEAGGGALTNITKGWMSATAGGIDTTAWAMVAKTDGTLWRIGNSTGGLTGDGTLGNSRHVDSLFTEVPTPSGGWFIDNIEGMFFPIVHDTMSGGRAWDWGNQNYIGYQLGQSTDYRTPGQINAGGKAIIDIASNSLTSYVITSDHHLWGWSFYSALLGIGIHWSGTTNAYTSPTDLTTMQGTGLTYNQIGCIEETSYAIMSDSTMRSWGDNPEGTAGVPGDAGYQLNYWVVSSYVNPAFNYLGNQGGNIVPLPLNPFTCTTKIKHIPKGGYYQRDGWVCDYSGHWYHLGRGKNGTNLFKVNGDPTFNQEADYPDWNNDTVPTLRNLYTTQYTIAEAAYCTANPGATACHANYTPPTEAAPTVNAGSNQTVYAPGATLSGSATPASGYSISQYEWSCTTCGPQFSNTFNSGPSVSNLSPGTNTFTLTVWDNYNKVSSASVIVTYSVGTQTHFYFAAAGIDTGSCSFANPCQTKTMFNSLPLVAGDTVSFNSGDSFTGGFIISGSGTLGDSIVINKYGTGPNPTITGALTVSSWNSYGSNVYGAACTGCLVTPQGQWGNLNTGVNMVVINNRPGVLARFPNFAPGDGNGGGGWDNMSGIGSNIIYDSAYQLRNSTFTALTGNGTNIPPAEIVYKVSDFGPFNRSLCTGDSVETTQTRIEGGTASPYFNAPGAANYGVFYQNMYQFLDTPGEYYVGHSPANTANTGPDSVFTVFPAGPSGQTVEVPVVDTLMAITGTGCSGQSCTVQAKYISINNINAYVANDFDFASDGHHFNLNNCNFWWAGMDNVLVGGLATTKADTGWTLQNSSAEYAMGSNVTSGYPNTYAGVWYGAQQLNDVIHWGGCYPGNGPGYYNTGYNTSTGNHGTIRYCSIDSAGYNNVTMSGSYDSVDHDFIKWGTLILRDGGLVYNIPPSTDHTDTANYEAYIVGLYSMGNSLGIGSGSNPTPSSGQGQYFDNETNHVTSYNNLWAYCAEAGTKLHNASHDNIRYSTYYGNAKEAVESDNDNTTYPILYDSLIGNIYQSTTVGTTIPASFWYFWENHFDVPAFDSTGMMSDSNYMAGYVNDSLKISYSTTGGGSGTVSLYGWQILTGLDQHSVSYQKTPVGTLYYDSTNSPITIPISGRRFDVYGNAYSTSVTLQPYTSLILFGQTGWYWNTTGSDANSTNSPSTPWVSAAKFNAVQSSLGPGDTVYFQRGQTFPGTWRLTASGIVWTDYGTGPDPVIGGMTPLTFSGSGSNFTAACSGCTASTNLFTMDTYPQVFGQTPNAPYQWITFIPGSSSTTTVYAPSFFATAPALTRVGVFSSAYTQDNAAVTAQTTSQITVSPALSYNNVGGNGFFYYSTPDTLGEWSYSGGAGGAITANSVSGHTCAAPSADTVIYVTGSNDKLSGIAVQGGNKGLVIANGYADSVVNDSLEYSGQDGIDGSNNRLYINHCWIKNIQNNAIYQTATDTGWQILNTTIKNVGMWRGMGQNGTAQMEAINAPGPMTVMRYLTIDSVGFNAVYTGKGDSIFVDSSHIHHCNLRMTDGAAVYAYRPSVVTPVYGDFCRGVFVDFCGNSNALLGTTNTVSSASYAFYADSHSNGWTVSGLVSINNLSGGVLNHGPGNAYSNLLVAGNGSGGYGFLNSEFAGGPVLTGVTLSNSTFYGTGTDVLVFNYTVNSDITTMLTSNGNKFYHGTSTTPFKTQSSSDAGTARTLASWVSNTGQDASSTFQGLKLSAFGNPAFSSATVHLPGVYTDITGVHYYYNFWNNAPELGGGLFLLVNYGNYWARKYRP